jgi:hypothetical protein
MPIELMLWVPKHPEAKVDMLGILPSFLSNFDPRPAAKQLDENYRHGGGWSPQSKFTMLPNGDLQYPGDPPMELLFETKLRDETIRFYNYAYVAIIQSDGSFEACRID